MDSKFLSDMKKRRNEAGLTLQETANKLSLSLDYVWKVESGRTTPSIETMTEIANLFGGLKVKKDGMFIFVVPEGEFDEFCKAIDDENTSNNGKVTIPSDSGLSLGDKAQRLSLEAGELRDTVDGLAKHIPSIMRGRDEGLAKLVELIKEADDLTEWGLAFRRMMQDQFPEQYKAARAIIDHELAHEFGVGAA